MEMGDSQPLTIFNYRVEIKLNGQETFLCKAGFSECSGLEMSMTPKTIQEGGRNNQQIHLYGPTTYGTLSLKRGLTSSIELWNWYEKILQQENYHQRASILVVLLAPDYQTELISFHLFNCLPVKLRMPTLNAMEGTIAIEEMEIAYERLIIESQKPKKDFE